MRRVRSFTCASYHLEVASEEKLAEPDDPWAPLWRLPLFAPATAIDCWLVVQRDTGALSARVTPRDGLARALARDALVLRSRASPVWLTSQADPATTTGGALFFDAPSGPTIARVLQRIEEQRGDLDESIALHIARCVLQALRSERDEGFYAPRVGEIVIGWDGEVRLVPRLFASETHGSLPLYAARELLLVDAADERPVGMRTERDDVASVLTLLFRVGRIGVENEWVQIETYAALAAELDRLEALFGRADAQHLAGITRGLFPEDHRRHVALLEALESFGLGAPPDLDALRQLEPQKEALAGREAHLLVERARDEPHDRERTPVLVLVADEGVHRFAMVGNVISIGSGPGQDISIDHHPALEEQHLELTWTGMDFSVRPLGPVFADAAHTEPLTEEVERDVGETVFFGEGLALTFSLLDADDDPDAPDG
jgi:hypothetical protein